MKCLCWDNRFQAEGIVHWQSITDRHQIADCALGEHIWEKGLCIEEHVQSPDRKKVTVL